MVSIKVKFSPSARNGQEGAICYQIIHDRKVRRIATGLILKTDEWDTRRSAATVGHDKSRIETVMAARSRISRDLERLHLIVDRLNDTNPYFTADDIVDAYRRFDTDYRLKNYVRHLIRQFVACGQVRTSETYRSALNSFARFIGNRGDDIDTLHIDCITPGLVMDYQAWLTRRGVMLNTVSFYMRILRAVYNRAVENGPVKDRHPFRHVYTGIDRTVKRALTLPVIRRIKNLDLNDSPALALARDMFMMSFYLRGMSFIDMAYLRKADLKGGLISYRRRKTGRLLMIGWTAEMQEIIDRYPPNDSIYLLPIICHDGVNERWAYRNAGYNINRNLKLVARRLKLGIPLTLYVARHSWATAARDKGIPTGIISEGMGHTSETTTRIYLASIDTSVIDKANSLIISSI